MKPRLRRQLAVLAAVSVAVLGFGTAPASADPTKPSPGNSTAIQRQLAAHNMSLAPRGSAELDHCTLMPSGHYGVGEWSSLMASDSADARTWVRSRGEAVASSASHGVSGIEDFSYTAPATAFYGYVLVNRSGTAGNVTIQRLG